MTLLSQRDEVLFIESALKQKKKLWQSAAPAVSEGSVHAVLSGLQGTRRSCAHVCLWIKMCLGMFGESQGRWHREALSCVIKLS